MSQAIQILPITQLLFLLILILAGLAAILNGDSIKYDVYFGTSSPPPKVTNNQTDTYYDTGMMNSTTKYYWKIVAWDIYYTSNESPISNFYTASPSNNPPTIADPNPINGKTDVSY